MLTKKKRPATENERLECGHVAAAGQLVWDDKWSTWCVPCDGPECEYHGTSCDNPTTVRPDAPCDGFGAVCELVALACPCDACSSR